MKTIFISVLTLIILNKVDLIAQTSQYATAMTKEISNLQQQHSPAELKAIANSFERISQAEPKEWHPLYFAGYATLLSGIQTGTKEQQDQLYDQSLLLLEKADKLSPENSEIYALKGYARYMKMAVDPMNRYGDIAAADAELHKAGKLNPDNPRIYLIRGQNLFYTPPTYGGGKEVAQPLLLKAKELYETFQPKHEFDPQWGKERVLYLLNQ